MNYTEKVKEHTNNLQKMISELDEAMSKGPEDYMKKLQGYVLDETAEKILPTTRTVMAAAIDEEMRKMTANADKQDSISLDALRKTVITCLMMLKSAVFDIKNPYPIENPNEAEEKKEGE